MNKVITSRNIKGEMCFVSDMFYEREKEIDNTLSSYLKGLVKSNNAVSFTWYSDCKHKLIIYPFKDEYGEVRAGYFICNKPTHHTNDIDRAIEEIVSANWEYDIYIKTA